MGVAQGLYTLRLRSHTQPRPEMAASDEDQDRDGSEAKPLLASQDSDLTLPPQTFVHGDFCSMHARIPNEEWDAGEAAAGLYQSCEFEGQTSWVRKRGVSDAYRHGQIAKSHYGLGTIVTIFADMD